MVDLWGSMSSGLVAGMVMLIPMLWPYIQHLQLHQYFLRIVNRRARRLAAIIDPYLSVTIAEYEGGRMKRSDAYTEVTAYLGSSCVGGARHLKAESAVNSDRFVLSMSDNEEITDRFGGATIWWRAYSKAPRSDMFSAWSGASQVERRFYQLHFLEEHREAVIDGYLPHIRQKGRAVMVQNRRRKLFTNISNEKFSRSVWSHVVFEHPSTFETLAMDPVKKQEIISDLDTFRKGEEYYRQIGKAWKRGYLLYGPPGTGKSAMIAAMANYMDYDIYDIELTSVRTNTDLRKLFIETTSKSILVMEDIDCSLDLTGKRKPGEKKNKKSSSEEKKEEEGSAAPPPDAGAKSEDSKVTLSGLLNFIDGLWSACGGERIIIFTTNHVEKLDPALIRTGRMDKHIEMSFCGFEAFKILAKNYLGVESSPRFGAVEELLQEVKMTPADVAENLMPKNADDDKDSCMERLVRKLQAAKEEAAAAAAASAENAASSSKQDKEETLVDADD